jgi:HD-GYP domain-containing protein (c-di-GMP phosphodiesterase class II)
MMSDTRISVANLLAAFSDALDMVDNRIAGHQRRTGYIARALSEAYGATLDFADRIHMAALIHDIGAISSAEKIALHRFEELDPTPHCVRGELLLRRSGIFADLSGLVRHHHRPISEWDRPLTDPLVLGSQIILLADYAERLIDRSRYVLVQAYGIQEQVHALSGIAIHPDLIAVFDRLAGTECFWLDIVSEHVGNFAFHRSTLRRRELDIDAVESIARFMRDIIDFKSPFTATHSTGVSLSAELLAKEFSFSRQQVFDMKIAGYMHDLGKLAVPNEILEKRGALLPDELAIIKSHTYHTYDILRQIDAFKVIAEWAAFHHERLNGTGYPFHLKSEDLTFGSKVMMVADVFTALSEPRPYRQAMHESDVRQHMREQADRGLLEKPIVEALLANFSRIYDETIAAEELIRGFYNHSFLNYENIPADMGEAV